VDELTPEAASMSARVVVSGNREGKQSKKGAGGGGSGVREGQALTFQGCRL